MVESKEPIVFPDYPLRFEDDPDPGQVFREKAELELRETPENRQKALQELVQLLKSEHFFFFVISKIDFREKDGGTIKLF
jgi:hypothetical protein